MECKLLNSPIRDFARGWQVALTDLSSALPCLENLVHEVTSWLEEGNRQRSVSDSNRIPYSIVQLVTLRLENNLQRKLDFPHRHLRVLIDNAKAINLERVHVDDIVRRSLEV